MTYYLFRNGRNCYFLISHASFYVICFKYYFSDSSLRLLYWLQGRDYISLVRCPTMKNLLPPPSCHGKIYKQWITWCTAVQQRAHNALLRYDVRIAKRRQGLSTDKTITIILPHAPQPLAAAKAAAAAALAILILRRCSSIPSALLRDCVAWTTLLLVL